MSHRANSQQPTRNSGARMGLGLAIGMATGFAIGLALDSIPIGVAIGGGLGVSFGVAFSPQEREPSKPMTIAGVLLLPAGIVVLAIMLHLIEPRWWCEYPILNLIPGC